MDPHMIFLPLRIIGRLLTGGQGPYIGCLSNDELMERIK